MSKTKKPRNEADVTIKALLESIFPKLLTDFFQADVASFETDTPEIPRVIKRQVDFLYKISNKDGEKMILQIEYQNKKNKEMASRMLEYYALIHRKHGLPVVQYVVYSAKTDWDIASTVKHPFLNYEYHLLNLQKIPYEHFLKSKHKEIAVLALLAGCPPNEEETMLEQVYKKAPEYADTIEILCKLRKIKSNILNKVMIPSIKLQDSVLYNAGIKANKAEMDKLRTEKAKMQAEIERLKAQLAGKK
jgi:Putative transposase, YhgA-like